MCGICGYAGWRADADLLDRMAGTIVHRGPDDEGFFCDGMIGLAVRRLSIIDVSGGKQPVRNEDGSVTLVFNGEIYNYQDLRRDLEKRGHRFASQADTETIVHLYEEGGIECVKSLRGMFGFALYDRRKETLFLARDRVGMKPLYYWVRNGRFLFGSEIKAILECDDVPREPHLPAIDAYLSFRYVPGPETMFAGIRKVPAAHWLSYHDGKMQIERYWVPRFEGEADRPDDYYRERFAELFNDTVRLHLQSDVPVGAFLSGGIDSSAIVAAMSRLTSRPVHTFAVGFDWSGDELPSARAVARELGCVHREVICRSEDIALLPRIVWNLDEPIGDAIVLPMYLLSRLARQDVKVVLTGEGADETLAGYLPHKVMFWARRSARWMPRMVRDFILKPVVACAPTKLLNYAFEYPGKLGARGKRRVIDYLDLVSAARPEAEYHFLISLFDARDKEELYDWSLRPFLGDPRKSNGSGATADSELYLNQILRLQFDHWLADNVLMKQDKITMANSVEGRVPFMDHVLVEFLCQVPTHLKLRGWTEKLLLRQYLADSGLGVPSRQPKKPFYIPLERYFATRIFRDLVATCLSEDSVRRRGYFAWTAVERLRRSVGGKDFLYGKQVLSLVMLELWHRIFIDREPGWTC